MSAARSILHIDMDAFFASVEQRDNPALLGKPVLVGYDGPRGVVAAASYEARKFGCHSAQPMVTAKRLCPDAIVVSVNGRQYSDASKQMFATLESFSPVIEPLSIDEAFLDLTGTERSLGKAEDVARRIKARIFNELHLTASIGLAPNKFLAKLASDMDKPDGLTIIDPNRVESILAPLPVRRIWGIGKVSGDKLANVGVRTIGDLQERSPDWLKQHFGAEANRYWRLARGIDDRPVVPDREAKGISHEHTFGVDVSDPGEVKRVLLGQVEQVAHRLRKHGYAASGVTLKIRFGDFQTITRSTSLDKASNVTDELWRAAATVFEQWPFQPVRLIGVAANRLSTGATQGELFTDPEHDRQSKLDQVADVINEKFGKATIKRAGPS